ncbi:MAG: hypothetical protein M3Z46_11540 [Actinomycetota bacterium]|nr:hypothetical protein [Actinomycetota bacterium]
MPTLDETSGPLRFVASFDAPGSAREAMIALEGLGIDAEAVRLLDQDATVPVAGLAESGELAAAQDVAGNYAKGAVVSAVVVACIAVAIVLVIGVRPRPLAVTLAAIGGAIGGFFLGGYLNAARRLPVNVDALDTFTIDEQETKPVRIEVRLSDPGLFDRSASVCRDHQAIKVERAES